MYLSNHRDIMLDASLLQNALLMNGFDTTEITFGANLMQGQLVIDIGKSNKMFRVERPGGSIREFYKASMHLSEYIRHTIVEKKQSVWIAQRNGRTKDGKDRTDQGIINMFRMSSEGKSTSLSQLNLLPVSVSYEWEPCDILKTLELYAKRQGPYLKKPGEDLNSILTGILQPKGRVHSIYVNLYQSLIWNHIMNCLQMISIKELLRLWIRESAAHTNSGQTITLLMTCSGDVQTMPRNMMNPPRQNSWNTFQPWTDMRMNAMWKN